MIKSRKTDFYILEERNGQWVLSVLCGGFAMFQREIVLTKEEVGLIEEWGDYYIEKMALDVAKEPSLFGDRIKL
jgi:hypothetical protein